MRFTITGGGSATGWFVNPSGESLSGLGDVQRPAAGLLGQLDRFSGGILDGDLRHVSCGGGFGDVGGADGADGIALANPSPALGTPTPSPAKALWACLEAGAAMSLHPPESAPEEVHSKNHVSSQTFLSRRRSAHLIQCNTGVVEMQNVLVRISL